MNSKHNVFLSYSHLDSAIAKHLASQLESAGVKCFMAEKDIGAGELWESTIRTAIQEVDRMVLLITPRSKNSLWVAAEAGAAWALEKELIAAMMFVEPKELMEAIKRHQARLIETPEQIAALVNELAPAPTFATAGIGGQWFEHSDTHTAFFKQVGDRVVGFYHYSSGNRNVGVYVGSLKDGRLDYEWRWLHGKFEGCGEMLLSADGKRLSGEWWYGKEKDKTAHLEYRRVSDEMPSWLTEADFLPFDAYFKGE